MILIVVPCFSLDFGFEDFLLLCSRQYPTWFHLYAFVLFHFFLMKVVISIKKNEELLRIDCI